MSEEQLQLASLQGAQEHSPSVLPFRGHSRLRAAREGTAGRAHANYDSFATFSRVLVPPAITPTVLRWVRAQLGWSVSGSAPASADADRSICAQSDSLNLLLCYYAAGNVEKMQEHFVQMLAMGTNGDTRDLADTDDEEDYAVPPAGSPSKVKHDSGLTYGESFQPPFPQPSAFSASRPSEADDSLLEQSDTMTGLPKRHKEESHGKLILAGALLAQALTGSDLGVGCSSLQAAFSWVTDTFRSHGYKELAREMELRKAAALLKACQIDEAVKVYRSIERTDNSSLVLLPQAATNLSFIHLLLNDVDEALRYADVALASDRYSASALVNKGCCLLLSGKQKDAKGFFLEALGLDAECVEALYNLGLLYKHEEKLLRSKRRNWRRITMCVIPSYFRSIAPVRSFQEALGVFERFNQMLPNQPEVVYHLGDVNEALGSYTKAMHWLSLLTSTGLRPTDASVLARMGAAAAAQADDDEGQHALHYFLSSYSFYYCSLDVITWLGVYYVKQQLFDKAAEFFLHAAALQPSEPKWLLMVASCYRRNENYSAALEFYQKVLSDHPGDMECLRCLITVCKEMGLPFDRYAVQLRKIEREQDAGDSFAPAEVIPASAEDCSPPRDDVGSMPMGVVDQKEPLPLAIEDCRRNGPSETPKYGRCPLEETDLACPSRHRRSEKSKTVYGRTARGTHEFIAEKTPWPEVVVEEEDLLPMIVSAVFTPFPLCPIAPAQNPRLRPSETQKEVPGHHPRGQSTYGSTAI
ncbi:tetratricopeptide repeat-containing protein [Cystoisospora suis]|uniref:Tetratricopeptide repeat-containing protein n=1 Tax=Cystoisospora suis TaxID=483139 RepID=A0A2C6KZH0_9APIC|nr:tetratricopeptide repeat-containing protein [Cystoisospora suis]